MIKGWTIETREQRDGYMMVHQHSPMIHVHQTSEDAVEMEAEVKRIRNIPKQEEIGMLNIQLPAHLIGKRVKVIIMEVEK